MNLTCCPPDEDLLPALAGETLPANVRVHLETCTDCRHRLDRLRAQVEDLRQATQPDDRLVLPEAPSRPAMIGKYLVVGVLDSGGQSTVYRALHPTLDKELAIKLGHRPASSSFDQRHLLVAEGKLLAQLEHPNLARVYDLDFHEDLPFLAMEYVRGPHLGNYAADSRLSPARAAAIVAEVARALAVVHRHGIVHQDLKPKNILMDEKDRPRLIDFGLARLRHAWDEGTPSPSGGTPAYMAPEQAREEMAAVGPRSDLFSLGAVLYFLLTGHAPFEGRTVDEALRRAQRCDFDRVALRRARVPRPLEAICLRALAPRPDERFVHAEEFAAALECYLARPRLWRRVLLGAAALLLVVVSVWWVTRPTPAPAPRPGAAPDVPSLAVDVARGEAYLGLREALPLRPATDRLQIVSKVPPGYHTALFHVDALGKVQRLAVQESPADAFTRLVFPGKGELVPLDPDREGTEFVLVCAAPRAEALEGLEGLVASTVATLPRLPPKVLVWLNRDEPKRQDAAFGEPETDPVAAVESKLDHLRQRLRAKDLPVMLGVAFAR